MKELLNDKKRLLLICGTVLLIIIAVALVLGLNSHSKTVKYENYMQQAADFLKEADYERAISYYERAFQIKDTDECAINLASAYAANGDFYKAEEILLNQIEHSKGKSETALKAALNALRDQTEPDKQEDGVTIAGQLYTKDATAIILADITLTQDDKDAIASFTGLTTLSLKNCGLTDLSFLTNCDDLMSLTLSNNNIKDLTPLKDLDDLKTLYLDNNPIEDFSPLYRLDDLTTLSIKGIDITQTQYDELAEELKRCSIFSDDTVAEELTLGGVTFQSDVTELDLSGKDIRDISVLEKCTQLQTLNLKDNSISDLSPLEELDNLTWLCLWNNDISDVSSLGVMTQLTYLDLEDNEITNINPLSSLTNLTELYLHDNDLSSLTALSSLTNLKKLGLRDTELTDQSLSVLSITSLTELDIRENEALTGDAVKTLKESIPNCTVIHDELSVSIKLGTKTFDSEDKLVDASNAAVTDLSELSKFTAVTSLILNNNTIADFSPISGLKNLTVLELWNTGASDITFLAGMSSLTNLNLAQNGLKDVYALSSCTGLTELILTGNDQLKDAAPLGYCTKLQTLYLDGTGVTDVSSLSGLTSLSTLSLDNCPLSDPTQLYDLTGLTTLYVTGCGLTQEDVTALKDALPNCAVYAGQ